jgi:hypothetical protein
MYEFVVSFVVIVIVWALYALGTQGMSSTKKEKGDQLSDRGVNLVQVFFWLVILVGIVAVIASSNS